MTAPLRRLLQNNVKFKWSRECQTAFEKLKQEIISDRVLIPFNPELTVQLARDASPTRIDAILSHIIDGQERPITFTSRFLS